MNESRSDDFQIELYKRVQTRSNADSNLLPGGGPKASDTIWGKFKDQISGASDARRSGGTTAVQEVVSMEMSTAILLTRSKELLQHFRTGSDVGDYQIEQLIGIGGYGAVFRVNRAGDQQKYAMKILNLPEHQLRDKNDGIYDLDMSALERLRHPGILTAHEVGSAKGYRYVLFDLFSGNEAIPLNLNDYERMFPSTMDQRTVLEIFRFLLDAVATAHSLGIVHLAIKPSNILLTMEPDPIEKGTCTARVTMSDWGTAMVMGGDAVQQILRRVHKQTMDKSAQAPDVGALDETSSFMAPEMIRSAVAGEQADIYSIGVIMRQLLTGVKGKVVVQPSSVNKSLHTGWNEIIKLATHPNLSKRFKSAKEFCEALDDFKELQLP